MNKLEETKRKLEEYLLNCESEKGNCSGLTDKEWDAEIEMYRTAIEAMEKQVAKRPLGISVTHEGRVANCPCCKKFITEQLSQNGCFYCLQKLDWRNKQMKLPEGGYQPQKTTQGPVPPTVGPEPADTTSSTKKRIMSGNSENEKSLYRSERTISDEDQGTYLYPFGDN